MNSPEVLRIAQEQKWRGLSFCPSSATCESTNLRQVTSPLCWLLRVLARGSVSPFPSALLGLCRTQRALSNKTWYSSLPSTETLAPGILPLPAIMPLLSLPAAAQLEPSLEPVLNFRNAPNHEDVMCVGRIQSLVVPRAIIVKKQVALAGPTAASTLQKGNQTKPMIQVTCVHCFCRVILSEITSQSSSDWIVSNGFICCFVRPRE